MFEEDGFTQYFAREDVAIPDHFTLYSNLEFLDFEVTDPVLYFYHQLTLSHDMTFPQPIEITLKDLSSHEVYHTGSISVDRQIP